MISVPAPTDSHVLGFCRTIRADSLPYLVAVQPAADAKKLDCFHNVRRVVDRSGGRIVYGWAIWEWRRVYIEAEHHAIYKNPEGELIDVTPTQFPQMTHTLFLPDDSAVYDFENEGIRRDNHRLALNSDPLVKALFETKRAFDELQNSISGVDIEIEDYETVARLKKIAAQNTAISKVIAWKFTRRNDPCFCGSGKKFKKCHGAEARR